MTRLEREALALLERINMRFVCVACQNSGGEGKHTDSCEFYRVLQGLRQQGNYYAV